MKVSGVSCFPVHGSQFHFEEQLTAFKLAHLLVPGRQRHSGCLPTTGSGERALLTLGHPSRLLSHAGFVQVCVVLSLLLHNLKGYKHI